MKTILLLSCVVASSVSAFAGERPMKAGSRELEMIKGLAGNWKGTGEMEGKPVGITTTFRVTPGGSAVVEAMDAGTPHEMTNVCHDVDGRMAMTHDCSMGNAPEMRVMKADGKSMSLTAHKAHGIDPKTPPHMHGLAYAWPDKDRMTATWTSANMGQEHQAPVVLKYERAP